MKISIIWLQATTATAIALKVGLMLIVFVALFGCENDDYRKIVRIHGGTIYAICLNGVTYYTIDMKFSVAWGVDSKVIPCE